MIALVASDVDSGIIQVLVRLGKDIVDRYVNFTESKFINLRSDSKRYHPKRSLFEEQNG